jgi:hypothetical protein
VIASTATHAQFFPFVRHRSVRHCRLPLFNDRFATLAYKVIE